MTPYDSDPFFQYPRYDHATSEGPVAMPILYFEDSNFMALYLIDFERARAKLEPAGLEPVRVLGGKALAGVAFYQYRTTTIGPYNEVGVAIAAMPAGMAQPALPLLSMFRSPDHNRVGSHILDLPVTTAPACAAGREIWGYPKFVTPIDFSLRSGEFAGAVADPAGGPPLVRLAGRTGLGVPGPLLDLVLYSRLDGRLVRATAVTRGGARLALPGSVRLEVSASDHRMAANLRDLGIPGAKPVFVTHTDRLQLRLNAGVVLP